MHLHFDRHGFDALKGNGLNIGDHELFFFSFAKLKKKSPPSQAGLDFCHAE